MHQISMQKLDFLKIVEFARQKSPKSIILRSIFFKYLNMYNVTFTSKL